MSESASSFAQRARPWAGADNTDGAVTCSKSLCVTLPWSHSLTHSLCTSQYANSNLARQVLPSAHVDPIPLEAIDRRARVLTQEQFNEWMETRTNNSKRNAGEAEDGDGGAAATGGNGGRGVASKSSSAAPPAASGRTSPVFSTLSASTFNHNTNGSTIGNKDEIDKWDTASWCASVACSDDEENAEGDEDSSSASGSDDDDNEDSDDSDDARNARSGAASSSKRNNATKPSKQQQQHQAARDATKAELRETRKNIKKASRRIGIWWARHFYDFAAKAARHLLPQELGGTGENSFLTCQLR